MIFTRRETSLDNSSFSYFNSKLNTCTRWRNSFQSAIPNWTRHVSKFPSFSMCIRSASLVLSLAQSAATPSQYGPPRGGNTSRNGYIYSGQQQLEEQQRQQAQQQQQSRSVLQQQALLAHMQQHPSLPLQSTSQQTNPGASTLPHTLPCNASLA